MGWRERTAPRRAKAADVIGGFHAGEMARRVTARAFWAQLADVHRGKDGQGGGAEALGGDAKTSRLGPPDAPSELANQEWYV